MAKIYPDTNRFLDFYRSADDKIDIFDELQKYTGNLVLTEQTITEFRRNRVSTLKNQATQFKERINSGGPHVTTVLQALPGHKELTESWATYTKKGKEVLKHLKQLIADEKKDPIAQKFLALAADAADPPLKLTDQAIDMAHRRKLLGNPPCSPGKYSVGDEVIWELLLGNMKEDLIVVTRDNTFHDNLSLLREEYQHRTGRTLLLVTDMFSKALKTIGQAPSKKLIEAEKKEQESWLQPGWRYSNSGDAANAVVQELYRHRKGLSAALIAAQSSPLEQVGGFPPELPQ